MIDKSVDAAHPAHAGAPRRRDVRADLRRDRSGRDRGVQGAAGGRKAAAAAVPRTGTGRPRRSRSRRRSRRCARPTPHPQAAAKMPAAAWPSADRREPDGSDTQWLDAVRQALVTHEASRAAGRSAASRPPRRRCCGPLQREHGCAGSGADTNACGDARRCRRSSRRRRPRCRRPPPSQRQPRPRSRARPTAIIRCRRAPFPMPAEAANADAERSPARACAAGSRKSRWWAM